MPLTATEAGGVRRTPLIPLEPLQGKNPRRPKAHKRLEHSALEHKMLNKYLYLSNLLIPDFLNKNQMSPNLNVCPRFLEYKKIENLIKNPFTIFTSLLLLPLMCY